jgi:hypothetical protein
MNMQKTRGAGGLRLPAVLLEGDNTYGDCQYFGAEASEATVGNSPGLGDEWLWAGCIPYGLAGRRR